MIDRIKKEISGEIMLEAIIVYPIVLMLLFFLMGVGFMLYQTAALSSAVNAAATEISQTYKYSDMSKSSEEITNEMVTSIRLYRYVFGRGNALLDGKREDTKEYLRRRLDTVTMAKKIGDVNVTMDIVDDELGRRHIVVTGEAQYEMLFSGILDLMGLNGKPKIKQTAIAQVEDISHYMNTVRYVSYLESLVDVPIVDSILGLAHTIEKILSGE